MENREVLKKIYQGGLQEHLQEDTVKIFLNNIRNDCVDHCIKDLSKQSLSEEEKLCSKNFMAKNYYLLSSNPELKMSHLRNRTESLV